jgi:hypothetical protein
MFFSCSVVLLPPRHHVSLHVLAVIVVTGVVNACPLTCGGVTLAEPRTVHWTGDHAAIVSFGAKAQSIVGSIVALESVPTHGWHRDSSVEAVASWLEDVLQGKPYVQEVSGTECAFPPPPSPPPNPPPISP